MSLLANTATQSTAKPSLLPLYQSPPCLQHSYAALNTATPAKVVVFAHAALFSPALSTLHQALQRGYLPNFMGLTTQALKKYPPQSVAMIKGHLNQTRKNQQLTTRTMILTPPTINAASNLTLDNDVPFPLSNPNNARSHHCFASVITPATGQIHSDQTRKFIVSSSTGNDYVLVVYDYDSNSILVEPMCNRTGPSILTAYTLIHTGLLLQECDHNSNVLTTSVGTRSKHS